MGRQTSFRFHTKLFISFVGLVFLILVSLHILHSAIKKPSDIGIKNIRFYKMDYDDVKINDLESSSYIINTSGCSIPKTPVMPSFFQKEWHIETVPDCNYEIKNFFMSDDEESVTFNPRESSDKCCLQEILPSMNSMNKSKYSLTECQNGEEDDTVSIKGKEMFVIKCGDKSINSLSINVDATFPINSKIQDKINYWKNIEAKPPNILIIGIDSVSRLHGYRSLPKTLKLLKEMNFYEFKGYHSAGPSTLANFMPLLMGLTLSGKCGKNKLTSSSSSSITNYYLSSKKDVRKQCAATWRSNFDDCPFLWKYLDSLHYVTSFIEDGEGSFNWGGLGGYTKKPTDYYIHPLFQALKRLRQKSFSPNATWWTKYLFTDCASDETIPEFVLRYTQRFTKKFVDEVPFFMFTWLAYPFHENIFSLASFDDKLHQFFQTLHDDDSLLENTLIIFCGDHGDRHSFFQSSSIEGFIERSLPPFYLRVPQLFDQKLPYHSIRLNLLKNTRRLITPWDIHSTLLHTLHLFSLPPSPIKSNRFEPNLSDRSSLFQVISPQRTCKSVNIPQKDCVCNTHSYVVSQAISNTLTFRKKLVHFLNQKLNEIVQKYKYSQICHQWFTNNDNIKSVIILGATTNYTDYLVAFSAYPPKKFASAIFEARLSIFNDLTVLQKHPDETIKNNVNDTIRLIGLTRINSYNNQSSCIGFSTDLEKEMKQFCVCKNYLQEK